VEIKTIYTAIDGKEFTDKRKCIEHQYNLVDYSKFTGHVYFVKIANSIITDEEIIPIVSLKHRELWNKMKESHIYLYVKDQEGIDVLRSCAEYFTDIDKYIAQYVDIGLNSVIDCGDNEEIINISNEIGVSEEDIKEIQAKIDDLKEIIEEIDKEEKFLKLDSFMSLFND